MPDRIIRDELLTSERYWTVSIQSQQLYVHLLLVADDAARCSGKNFTLRSACYPGRAMEPAELERMLQELSDADLVRPYIVDGERYVFIPRFKNRRRYVSSSKYPEPPNEINDMVARKSDSSMLKTDSSQTQVIPKSGGVGVGVGVGVGEKIKPLSSKLDDARLVLEYLNRKANKRFLPIPSNLKMISARIAESSVDLCKQVIDAKVVEWGRDEKMRQYIRPATIFNPTNFGSYAGNDDPKDTPKRAPWV